MKLLLTITAILVSAIAYCQKVGINTTTPAMNFHVRSTDSATMQLENGQPLADSVKTSLYFSTNLYYTGAIKTHITSADALLARMGFFTYTNGFANQLKERMSILDNGFVGIGTVKPTAMLEVNGSFKLNGGSPAAGKVLTSDATGNASWVAPAAMPVIHAYMDGDIVMEHNVEYQVPFSKNISGGIDTDNGYNNATDEYTIPSDGIYNFYANFLLQGSSAVTLRMSIQVYNSTGTLKDAATIEERTTPTFFFNKQVEHTFSLVQGDRVRVKVFQFSGPGTTITLHNVNTSQTYFRGFKIR